MLGGGVTTDSTSGAGPAFFLGLELGSGIAGISLRDMIRSLGGISLMVR